MYSPEKLEKKQQEAFELRKLAEREKSGLKIYTIIKYIQPPDIAREIQKLLPDLLHMILIHQARLESQ